jgi:hypothetical protein
MTSEAVGAGARFELFRVTGRGVQFHSFVLPAGRVITPPFRVPAGEEPIEILRVLEVVADNRGRVGIGDDVLPEELVVLADVVDDAAQEGDVTAGPDRNIEVCVGARAREPGIDVDHSRPAELGFHHPLEADRMALGHIRTHDDDAVGVGEVLLEGGGAPSPE